jgi:Cd2+/Zn2+-exporting ATPase
MTSAAPERDSPERVGTASAKHLPTGGLFSARAELRAAILAGVLLGLGFVLHVVMEIGGFEVLIWASLAIGMVYGGRAALSALAQKRFDIDVLMVVGAGLAAYVGHPEEGALLLFLFVLAGALEELAAERTSREVEALQKLMPAEALVLRDGAFVEARAETLVPGEIVRIRPGERVPADASVVVGSSSMDQSAITGESMPRAVKPVDELFAGTINTDDPLEARVLRPVRESSVQKILDLVLRAREQREPVQRAIDRLSQPYAVGVMVVSLVVALVWWLVLDRPLLGGEGERGALYTAITLLIVASPCALVIATPTATLAGIARAARAGVLFKGGRSIEALARIGAVCLDKTGTLTLGRPRLYEVHPVAWSDGPALLAIAAGLERDSTHPIAVAVREAAAQRNVAPAAVESVNHVVARGIVGAAEGREVRLGNLKHTEALIPICYRNRVRDVLSRIQDRGHLGVVVVRAGTVDPVSGQAQEASSNADLGQVAVLIMADTVRPGAATLARELHDLAIRPVVMLTGDHTVTAARVGQALGLDEVHAEMLPQGKLDAVASYKQRLREQGRRTQGVAVIGDGVNDAPALASADVAMAIGTIGTAAALESADAVLLNDDLSAIPWAIRLARRTRRIVLANLTFALLIIVLMGVGVLVGSLTGHDVPLAVGVLAHEGGTILVVANSLRLLWTPGPGRPAPAPASAAAVPTHRLAKA